MAAHSQERYPDLDATIDRLGLEIQVCAVPVLRVKRHSAPHFDALAEVFLPQLDRLPVRGAVGGAVPRVVVARERGAIGHALLGDQALQRREPVAPGLYPACRPVASARLCYITILTNKTAS